MRMIMMMDMDVVAFKLVTLAEMDALKGVRPFLFPTLLL